MRCGGTAKQNKMPEAKRSFVSMVNSLQAWTSEAGVFPPLLHSAVPPLMMSPICFPSCHAAEADAASCLAGVADKLRGL
jgi:hypothetical protein